MEASVWGHLQRNTEQLVGFLIWGAGAECALMAWKAIKGSEMDTSQHLGEVVKTPCQSLLQRQVGPSSPLMGWHVNWALQWHTSTRQREVTRFFQSPQQEEHLHWRRQCTPGAKRARPSPTCGGRCSGSTGLEEGGRGNKEKVMRSWTWSWQFHKTGWPWSYWVSLTAFGENVSSDTWDVAPWNQRSFNSMGLHPVHWIKGKPVINALPISWHNTLRERNDIIWHSCENGFCDSMYGIQAPKQPWHEVCRYRR